MKTLLILLTVFAFSCQKDGPAPEPSGPTPAEPATDPAAPTDPAAEPTGEPTPMEPTGKPGTPTACKSDGDCVASCARAGNCCDQLCEPCRQAFHKSDLAAHEQWRSASCAATSCPVAKCMPPKEEAIAKCQAGACVVELRPMKAAP